MSDRPQVQRLTGSIRSVSRVSAAMFEFSVDLEGAASFLPGQFCMLNLADGRGMTLSRPFSILGCDTGRLDLLFKVVGGGTRLLADCEPGATVVFLGPLGRAFPEPESGTPNLLLAGGVGLPPLLAWQRRWGRSGDLYLFGGRDGGDVPWELLTDVWRSSVDRHEGVPAGREAYAGTVVDMARRALAERSDVPHRVLACGPRPLLRAAAELAGERGWTCYVSMEERMGCGYGVCRGCVTPRADDAGWFTVCADGPVFDAAELDWKEPL